LFAVAVSIVGCISFISDKSLSLASGSSSAINIFILDLGIIISWFDSGKLE
jgi:hypothetical protein